MSPRSLLVQALEAAYPDRNVYGSPPGKIELPTVLVGPDVPYVTRESFCLLTWHFLVSFPVGRTSENQPLDQLDDLITEAWPVLNSLEGIVANQVRAIELMEIGGSQYVAATFPVTLKGSL